MTGPKTLKLALAGNLLFVPILTLAQEGPSLGDGFSEMEYGLSGPTAGMISLIVIVGMALFFAMQREKRRQDLVARFLDNGREIPPGVLPPTPSRQRELRRGVWLASLGIGIGLVLFIATSDWRVAAWCLILLFLSAASFLNAAFFYRDPGSGR